MDGSRAAKLLGLILWIFSSKRPARTGPNLASEPAATWRQPFLADGPIKSQPTRLRAAGPLTYGN